MSGRVEVGCGGFRWIPQVCSRLGGSVFQRVDLCVCKLGSSGGNPPDATTFHLDELRRRRLTSSHTVTCARRRKVRHAIAPGTADPHRTHDATWTAHAAGRLESRIAALTIGWTSRGIRAQPCETIASATRNRHTRPDRRRIAPVSPQNPHRAARSRAYCQVGP